VTARVLVVEDADASIAPLRAQLTAAYIEVTTARDGPMRSRRSRTRSPTCS
jgi:hypothetical protein